MPTKLPSDIPKFEGKAGEVPQNHIMSFHLWCSSNSIVDDSIRLRLLQRTFTGSAAKWYIEQPHGTHATFTSLASTFLQFFQLPVRYDAGVEILLSCRQNTATHITDHIHEWRRRRSLCKIKLDDRIFLDWFLKSLLPIIAKDVASERPQSEEEAILKAQQFNLIYAQSGYLYTIIPDAPRGDSSQHDAPGASHTADGIIGRVSSQPQPFSIARPTPGPDPSRVTSQSVATNQYAPVTPHHHTHGPSCPP